MIPALSLTAGKYQFLVRIFYQDNNYEYSDLAANRAITFKSKAGIPFLGILVVILLTIGGLYLLCLLINAIVNRYFYHGKKQQQFDIMRTVKSAIYKKE